MVNPRFRRSEDVRASFSEDGLVLLDLTGGLVLASNVVGGRIWALLEHEPTAFDLARQLADEFGAPYDRVCSDVANFLDALRQRGLLNEVIS